MADGSSWMESLEEQVEAIAAEVARLREENEGLRQEIATTAEGGGGEWSQQREEIKSRVERLVDRLETLLESE